MILKQELTNIYIDYSIIVKEISLINNDLISIYDLYHNKIDINNINRKNLLYNLENNFQCYSIQQSFSIILKLSIKLNELKEKYNILCKLFGNDEIDSKYKIDIVLSPLINKWLTEIKTLSIASAEGYVLKNGFRFLNNLMVIKTPKSINNSKSLIHEYFIGLHLNNLRKIIPNFMFTYALFNCNVMDIEIVKNTVQSTSNYLNICEIDSNKTTYLLLEFINGNTITDYLKNDYLELNMNFLITTIAQVLCSLQIAYDTYGYCHNDLHASNIVMRDLPDKKYIKYEIKSRNNIYHILTDKVATIIDYGYNSLDFNNSKYKTTYFMDRTQKIVDWSLNKYKTPGIDLAKFFIHIYNILKVRKKNYNFDIIPLLECIDDTFYLDFGISGLFLHGNHNRYYPIVYDTKLHDINPADFLEKFISRLDIKNINYKNFIYTNTNPPLGYIVLNDSTYCKSNDIKETLDILTDNNENIEKCGTNNWKSLKEWKYQDGTIGNWIECGKYIDHIDFNTILYPEGLTLYKGSSKIIELNLEFENSNEVDLNYISALFFGDYNEALDDSINDKCGVNCISTYKIKYDMEFFNLFDKKNIKYLFDNNILDMNDKIEISDLLSIDLDNFENFTFNKSRKLSYLPKFINKIFDHMYKFNIYGIIHKYNSDKYQIIIYNNLNSPFVYRDLSNILDWQYFDNRRLFGEIGNFIKDFRKYKLQNTSEYQGNPYQISVWTSLYIQKQFIDNTYLVNHIDTKYFNVAISAGFLHSIGYGGSLNYNITISYEEALKNASNYLLDESNPLYKKYLYNIGNETKELNISKVLRDMNISSEKDVKLVIFLILSIKVTIETLYNLIKLDIRNINGYNNITLNYISLLLDNLLLLDITFDKIDNVTKDIYKNYFILTILVSMCSIMGKLVYIDNNKFYNLQKKLQINSSITNNDLNSYLESLPFIKNEPRSYKGNSDINKQLFKLERSSKILINFIRNYVK